jgi:hypothetical protein
MTGIFRNRWWVVFATICGLIVGAGPINVFTFGVFLKPITEDLGLSRGAFSAALMFHAAVAAIAVAMDAVDNQRAGAAETLEQEKLATATELAPQHALSANPDVDEIHRRLDGLIQRITPKAG